VLTAAAAAAAVVVVVVVVGDMVLLQLRLERHAASSVMVLQLHELLLLMLFQKLVFVFEKS
jgi:hypothetical protein